MKNFLTVFLVCVLLNASAHAHNTQDLASAHEILESIESVFIDVQQKVGPAVVTISVSQSIPARQGGYYGNNPQMDDLLKYFFGIPPQQPSRPPKDLKRKGMGSGFILDKEGHILTNDHVVDMADEIEVTLPDGRMFGAKLAGRDPRSDLALIKIEGDNLPTVVLGDSDTVSPGQWTIALGNPFGNVVNNPKPTMTSGIVSAIHRTINVQEEGRLYGDLIQTDASINQGNSGGPLVNLRGEVIGINTLIFSPSGGSVGLGFAIPINRGKSILEDLIQGKEIAHSWLGIWLQELNAELKKQFGFDEGTPAGSLVFKVEPDSPAAKAGLSSGDVLTHIEGEKIHSSGDVTRIVSNKRPGDKLSLKFIRQGTEKETTLTVGKKPSAKSDSPATDDPKP